MSSSASAANAPDGEGFRKGIDVGEDVFVVGYAVRACVIPTGSCGWKKDGWGRKNLLKFSGIDDWGSECSYSIYVPGISDLSGTG